MLHDQKSINQKIYNNNHTTQNCLLLCAPKVLTPNPLSFQFLLSSPLSLSRHSCGHHTFQNHHILSTLLVFYATLKYPLISSILNYFIAND